MSQRCINAFLYDGTVYPNGFVVADDAPILGTHATHFAAVDEVSTSAAVEQAVAEPGGLRSVLPKRAKSEKPKPAEPVQED